MFGRLVCSLTILIASAHCGGDDASCTEEQPPDDGKVRPATNGVSVAEVSACEDLRAAFDARADSIGACVVTVPTCPGFLRGVVGQHAEVDQGSVDGCKELYASKSTCDELKRARESCAVTPHPLPERCP